MNTAVDKILDHSSEYAKELLIDTGELYPFGAYIGLEGNVHPVEYEYDKKNMPTVGVVIDALSKYCETEMKEGKILAYGLTYEASVQLEKDADFVDTFVIDIVIKDGTDVPLYYYPYHISANKTVTFDDPFAVKR
jgi:hypothetical protein